MLENPSFRFYQLPDLQRSIDILLGIFGTFALQQLWKNRQLVVKEFRMFYMFYFALFSWAHSDFFFVSALVFTKIHKKSMANMCGKQALKTFGTFPLLVLACDLSNFSKGGKASLSRNWNLRDFDFHSELKQIIAKSKE